jgi:predicted  nucleic acid-binding Zn-ribbon protein
MNCIKCGSLYIRDGREGYDYSCGHCGYNWHEDESTKAMPEIENMKTITNHFFDKYTSKE